MSRTSPEHSSRREALSALRAASMRDVILSTVFDGLESGTPLNTVQDFADVLGVSRPTLYRYFPQGVADIAEATRDRLIEGVVEQMEIAVTALERLEIKSHDRYRRIVTSGFSHLDRNRQAFDFAYDYPVDFTSTKEGGNLLTQFWSHHLLSLEASGTFPQGLHPTIYAKAVTAAMIEGAVHWSNAAPDPRELISYQFPMMFVKREGDLCSLQELDLRA